MFKCSMSDQHQLLDCGIAVCYHGINGNSGLTICVLICAGERDVAQRLSVRSWCDGSLD